MGYDDLNVVDPTSGEALAASTDMNDVRLFVWPMNPFCCTFEFQNLRSPSYLPFLPCFLLFFSNAKRPLQVTRIIWAKTLPVL